MSFFVKEIISYCLAIIIVEVVKECLKEPNRLEIVEYDYNDNSGGA